MATRLGPHLLDELTGHFEYEENGVTKVRTEQSQLLDWQPPVCLVLLNTVDREKLAPIGTETEGACLDRLHSMQPADLKQFIDIQSNSPIKYIEDYSQLQKTKVIGRIFLYDDRVEAQITANPEKAAQFHHNLVLAARAKLNAIEAKLADRVNYWVVVNEVLGTTEADLKKLGQYEMKRMALVKPAGKGNLIYGCGLFAFANATPPTNLWKQELKENSVDYGIQAVLKKANDDNLNHSSGPQHVLLLHQYFKPDRNGVKSEGEGANKKRFLTDANLQNNVRRFEHYRLEDFQAKYGNLKVIISEYGLDGRIDLDEDELHLSRGWKYFAEWSGTTESEAGDGAGYLQALKALDRSNRGYKDVILGYCIYGWGYNFNDEFWSYPLDKTPERHAPTPPGPRDRE